MRRLVWAMAVIGLVGCSDDDNDSYSDSQDNAPVNTNGVAEFAVQVAQGQTLYGSKCAGCHGNAGQGGSGPKLVGLDEGALPLEPRGARKERFEKVSDVATYVVVNMPPGAGGSLSNDEYLAILAFALSANEIELEQKLTLDLAGELVIPR